MTVKFAELPPAGAFGGPGASIRWQQVAEQLRARPGQWAHVSQHSSRGAASATSHAIKTGRIVSFKPTGSFESTIRGLDVWARYVPRGGAG